MKRVIGGGVRIGHHCVEGVVDATVMLSDSVCNMNECRNAILMDFH